MGEFGNRLFELRKKSGLSQEKLAEKLHVSRQTLSKWELGESTPDLEKLTVISELFEISLDELVLGKETPQGHTRDEVTLASVLDQKVLTDGNRQKAKKTGKIFLIVFGVLLVIDMISMMIYFLVNGIPA